MMEIEGYEGEFVLPTGTPPPDGPPDRSRGSRADAAPEAFADTDKVVTSAKEPPVVLIAEDEETIAESLAMIIEDAGYTAIVAFDGKQALLLAQQRRPCLILTDLMMPYLNGADLIAEVRRDASERGYAPPRTVLVTAASRARAEEAGADVIIAKPFDLTKIESVVERLVRGRTSAD